MANNLIEFNAEQEENEFTVEKKESIKNRLQRVFITISISIVFLMSAFSLVYFYFFIRNEAISLVRNKIHLVEVFLDQKK